MYKLYKLSVLRRLLGALMFKKVFRAERGEVIMEVIERFFC